MTGEGTSGVRRGISQTIALSDPVTSPRASGLMATTLRLLAVGTTIRPGTPAGEATKRSVLL